MGLIYDAGESSALSGALSANLNAATAVLDSTDRACSQLVGALGSGELSGQGYSAVDALFAEIVGPCISDAKAEIQAIQGDLDKYLLADSRVSQYGVLKEVELGVQLEATRDQRDATLRLIETNRAAADAAVTMPTLAASLEMSNAKLEVVLAQLEIDIEELERKLTELRDFAARTAGLFVDRLVDLAAAIGDTVSLLNTLDSKTIPGVSPLMVGSEALAVARVYEYLRGRKLTRDADGRIKLGKKFIYNPSTNYLYKDNGQRFNTNTGLNIDTYKQPIKAGVGAALTDTVSDFKGWGDASLIGKAGKFLGAAGTVLTVGANANHYFHDGAEGNDIRDFAIDTAVDLGGAALAAGAGAAVGSLVLPPLGTVVGAIVGLAANLAMTAPWVDGKSLTDLAKEGAKDAADWLASKFW